MVLIRDDIVQQEQDLRYRLTTNQIITEYDENGNPAKIVNATDTSTAPDDFSPQIVWRNVVLFAFLHTAAVYGLYLAIFSAQWMTIGWTFLVHICGGLGITMGAHRLWSHRSYKANAAVRTVLMLWNSISMQNDVIEWCRDHRVHHKFSETSADPHDSRRGLFFSHMGWLLCRKHPDVKRKGATVPIDDLLADPILAFQKKYYLILAPFMCFVFPSIVPLLWGEDFATAYFVCGALRYTITLHITWTVNSIAHLYGNQPYDVRIQPRQNLTSTVLTLGEGWHNYHHAFPQDYRASEHPWWLLGRLNFTTLVIDTCASLGMVTDRHAKSDQTVSMRAEKHGDKTRWT